MVLKLGKNAPDNASEIYTRLKSLLDNNAIFICLVYDTTAQVYLSDCEVVKLTSLAIQLVQVRQDMSDEGVTMFKYVYEFYPDGTYRRIYKSIKMVTE